MSDLLIELFSEEIPAGMQKRASTDFQKMITEGLKKADLSFENSEVYATPRRLVLSVKGLLDHSPTVTEERKGPRVGAPEKALEGFLRGAGVSQEDLEIRDEKKGQVYYAKITKSGRCAEDIVAEVLESTVRGFPWPKSMRWGSGALKWVRPLHSIICTLTKDALTKVVPLDIDGIVAGNTSQGHRFMAPAPFEVNGFLDYQEKLAKAYVVLDPQKRMEKIWQDACQKAQSEGLEVVEDQGLLAEVAGLVEWPVVLMGDIAEDFYELPTEVLQTSMKEHQKFFSVKNPKTDRIEKFITVANRETKDQGATILSGNQKVLFARLSDAKFFWENDNRTIAREGMAALCEPLKQVTFHNKLGSQAERIERIANLSEKLSEATGVDAQEAILAAKVVKADLSSEMVYEFPELQGIMGRYYAQAAGLSSAVADACRDHYSPLGPTDTVPQEPVSVTIALADKLDLLTGFWAVDEKPTGSKDPFALRRAALGVIRLIITNDLRLNLKDVFATSFEGKNSNDLMGFIHDRLKVFLKDEGIRHDVIDACLMMEGADDIALLVKRARALSDVLKTDDGSNLIQGFKRANNILSQAEAKDGVEYSYGPDVKFAEETSEKALFEALDSAEAEISSAMSNEEFERAMSAMASLRSPVDAFFEAVQINADNEIIRRNRLNLLGRIREICAQVADLTRVEG